MEQERFFVTITLEDVVVRNGLRIPTSYIEEELDFPAVGFATVWMRWENTDNWYPIQLLRVPGVNDRYQFICLGGMQDWDDFVAVNQIEVGQTLVFTESVTGHGFEVSCLMGPAPKTRRFDRIYSIVGHAVDDEDDEEEDDSEEDDV